jgi:hypothetical protein
MAEVVDILVRDVAVPNDGIQGVVVFVYDATGSTLVTSGTTDADGHVEFMLPGTASPTPTEYQLRTYKQGISSPQPNYIEVYEPAVGSPTGTNNFRLEAAVFILPPSPDPDLCRVSGYMRGPDGRPKGGIDIHFIQRFNPLVVSGVGVMGERVTCRTDATGYIQVDLWRKGVYRAVVQGHENVGRDVLVPDLTSANINYLLFPRVYGVTFDPPGPWSLAAGDELTIDVEVTLTSGYVSSSTAPDDLVYSLPVGDAVASLQVLDDQLILRGSSSGTSVLTIERADNSLAYLPDDAVVGSGTAITVV